MNENYWYAVMQDDSDDDWGYGSYDLDEALEMLKNYPGGHIEVISEGGDPICVDVIRSDEATTNEEENTMTKTYIIDNTEYTVRPCTAIALNAGDTERQDALLVTSAANGEQFDFVVFGYELPADAAEFADMADDSSAWDSDHETLATVEIDC